MLPETRLDPGLCAGDRIHALNKGEDALTEYRFNTQKIQHLFCETCGVESFARGGDAGRTPMVAVNVRCLAGVEPTELSSTLLRRAFALGMTMVAIAVEPGQDETREAVLRGLSGHNQSKVGPRNPKPLTISLRDESGAIVGGLVGELKWEWLYVDLLWIDERPSRRRLARRWWRRPSRRRASMVRAASISRTMSIQAPELLSAPGLSRMRPDGGLSRGRSNACIISRRRYEHLQPQARPAQGSAGRAAEARHFGRR